jgi:hypothetical protein
VVGSSTNGHIQKEKGRREERKKEKQKEEETERKYLSRLQKGLSAPSCALLRLKSTHASVPGQKPLRVVFRVGKQLDRFVLHIWISFAVISEASQPTRAS